MCYKGFWRNTRAAGRDADSRQYSVKGRPHYYSTKKEEYAHVKFDLDAGTFLGYGRLVLAPSTLLFYFSNEKLANTISADLTSLFSWNTKQVFVYVVASFPPTTNPSPSLPNSEAIIWDAIIPASSAPLHPNTYIHPTSSSSSSKSSSASKSRRSKSKDQALAHPVGASPGILRLNSQRPKYQITTPSSRISNLDNCTLTLHYNIQPWVGALVWGNPSSAPLSPYWSSMEGGKSEVFRMPELKGASAVKKEELRTETGGERNRGSPA